MSGWHLDNSVRLKTGDKFFSLTAIKKADSPQMWVFRCECGREITLMARDVIAGYKSNCGSCKRTISTFGQDPKKLGEEIMNSSGIKLLERDSTKAGEDLRKRDPRYRKAHENGITITEINMRAIEEGISYGEYVRKHGL